MFETFHPHLAPSPALAAADAVAPAMPDLTGPGFQPGGGSAAAMTEVFGGLFDGFATAAGPIKPVQPGRGPHDRPKNPDQQPEQDPEPEPKPEPKKPPGYDGKDGFEEKKKPKPGMPQLSPAMKEAREVESSSKIALLLAIAAGVVAPELAIPALLLGGTASLLGGRGDDDPGVPDMT